MSLGIECGATGTSILLVSDKYEKLQRGEFGPANFNLLSGSELKDFFENVKKSLPDNVKLINLGVGMPGIGDAQAKEVVTNLLKEIWPSLERVWVGSDAETALACIRKDSDIKLIVIAGTGSNCHAKDSDSVSKVGGFGHILGDRGSSFAIAQKALRLALREFEHKCALGTSPEHNKKLREVENIPDDCIVKYFMEHKKIPSIAQLVQWSVECSKTEMAGLAVLVIKKWKEGNLLAKGVIEEAIKELAEDCSCLVKKFLNKPQRYSKITIGLTGSLFTKNEDFSKGFKQQVSAMLDLQGKVQLHFRKLLDTVQGALAMVTSWEAEEGELDDLDTVKRISRTEMSLQILPDYTQLPLTESRNPNSMFLDTISTSEAIDLMLKEESAIHVAIAKHKQAIEELVLKISKCFQQGGRLFYVGAGTSGRLGVLDASECPPTFKSPPEWVQGIIAGGSAALTSAIEGAEDSVLDGSYAAEERKIGINDIVIGIAASGRTPFVWGTMFRAHTRGAFTAFLTFNPSLKFKWKPDVVLALDVGPEVLTGSTRLKCGTATKCILNMLSTLAMVNYGKCFENLMVDLSPANQKLKDRALRIVLLMIDGVKGISEEKARQVLLSNNYDIRKTVEQLRG
ncbi:N-acetylmuramic acid 6-phosphate etherase [Orchesella cincta]|uniref:N-acetyl-D-glucosamine kinase n=1 Tax=Orchesella cincta TaxID=48709 RepID=A0A1D2NG23_ORCCI|nr:N-acetylmuramic acid 6-phosphate etherase [Orchesella cincta]